MRFTYSSTCALIAVLGGLSLIACGEDAAGSVELPYAEGQTVVSSGSGRTTVDTPTADGCLDGVTGECIKPQETCGEGAAAEVLLDEQGALVKVVCYPRAEDSPTVDHVDGSLKPEADGTVIALDDQADGEDITNNVELGGNDVVLYGHGPDVSVVGGNLKVVGNNVVVRGVTVLGEVDLEGSGAVMTDCIIMGNLHIQGSNVVVADCTIFGDVSYDGQDGAMIRNLVQSGWRVRSESTECSGNSAFEDADENLVLSADEIGDALSCPAQ